MNGLYLVGFQRYTLKCAYRRDSYKLKYFAKFKTKNESKVMFSDVKLGLLGDLIASYIDVYSSSVLKICSLHTTNDSFTRFMVFH